MNIENVGSTQPVENGNKPYEYTDPRALSEAWYQALHGNKNSTHGGSTPQASTSNVSSSEAQTTPVNPSAANDNERSRETNEPFAASTRGPRVRNTAANGSDTVEQRFQEKTTRKRDETQRPQPSEKQEPSQAHVELKTPDGARMRMLFQETGDGLRVTVVGDQSRVSALEQERERVRLALAARGIRAQIDVHSEENA